MVEKKTVNGVSIPDLGKAIHAFRHDPGLGRFQFRATNRWIDGGHSETTIAGFYGAGEEHTSGARPFKLEAGEPDVLLGQDEGPNPVEHLLNALAACVTTSLVYHAAARGIALQEVESRLEGDIDIRGFLGLTDEVRRGYQNIRITFRVKGDGTREQLEELCRFSPVLDVVTHGTPVAIEVQKVGEAEHRPAGEVGVPAQP
jgi:uncharacterized OsmC-like protein